MSETPRTTVPWTPLRIVAVVGAGLGLMFSLGTVAWWWRIPDIRRDGLELMGLFLATAHLVCFVLPALVLGLAGRWLALAAILGLISAALAIDAMFPWLPWHWLPGPP